jgi:hypothetical protein
MPGVSLLAQGYVEMASSGFELVHTINDWYDGPRAGVADLNGKPHYYECQFDDVKDDWADLFLLAPIDEETFQLVMEDWAIWLRWDKAFREGKTTQETHPALPEDRERHAELAQILVERLVVSPDTEIKARAEFKFGEPTLVKWLVSQERARI